MAGNQEHEFSSDVFPTPQEAARRLISAANQGLLIHGNNWRQFEPIAPGATQAGMFVEVVKHAKNLRVRSTESFTLPKMIWYEVVDMLPNTPDERLSGEARALLIALVGGQLYSFALNQNVPESIGEFYDNPSPVPSPRSLTELFAIPLGFSIELYGGGPLSYHDVQARIKAKLPLFSEEELQYAARVAEEEEPGRRGDQYRVGSRVLLEMFIGRLQTVQAEIDHGPPLLPSPCRRDIEDI